MKNGLQWIKRILLALASIMLLLLLAVHLGGNYAINKYLSKEIVVGENALQVSGTSISIDWIKTVFHFEPTLALKIDSLEYKLLTRDQKNLRGIVSKPKPISKPFSFSDTLALPEFKIPVAAEVEVKNLIVSDSLGKLITGSGIEISTVGSREVNMYVQALNARDLKLGEQKLPIEIKVDVNWKDVENIKSHVNVVILDSGKSSNDHGKDGFDLNVISKKTNLLKSAVELKVNAATSKKYFEKKNSPEIKNLEVELGVAFDSQFKVNINLKAMVMGLSDTGQYQLGTQKLSVKMNYQDSAGIWEILSTGSTGEKLNLQGNVKVTDFALDSLMKPDFLLRKLAVNASGSVDGVRVKVNQKWLAAKMELKDARFSDQKIGVNLVTGDGSSVMANVVHVNSKTKTVSNSIKKINPDPLQDWRGTFSVEVAPEERFLKAFTDTQVVFQKLSLQGNVKDGKILANTAIKGFKAYGFYGDQILLNHTITQKEYRLRNSKWISPKGTWLMAGEVKLQGKVKPIHFHLESSENGKLDFNMPSSDRMQAKVSEFKVDKLPYHAVDTLAANHPILSGEFDWDKKLSTGNVNVTLNGQYKNENLKFGVEANWTRDLLNVKAFNATVAQSKMSASARLALHGLPFYQVHKLILPDYELVHIESNQFDLAKALSIAIPESPLKSGTLSGDFTYQKVEGFSGNYQFQNIQPTKDDFPITLKKLTLTGKGDTLGLFAVTASDKEPLYNDTLNLSLTGALSQKQSLLIYLKSQAGVEAKFLGKLNAYQDIQGALAMSGKLSLPNQGGEILGLKVNANLSMPFKQGMAGLKIHTDTLNAIYAVTGIDTQFISAKVESEKGIVSIPTLNIRGKGGSLQGNAEYNLVNKKMRVLLEGSSLALQMGVGDKIQLRDLHVEMKSDSLQLSVQGDLGKVSAEHIKSPLRAAGDLSRVHFVYRMPVLKKKNSNSDASFTERRVLPFLQLSAVLDSSNVHYRLRGIESIQSLFKKTTVKHTGKRSTAMDVQINLETAGTGNVIETDVLRLSYVGNISMVGTYPYALMRGRVSSREGSLGAKAQAYQIRRCEFKWLNVPMEEGTIELNSEKKLARTCEAGVTDSCSVMMHLTGPLNNIQFSYDSDCQGSYGAGVEVSALIFSVRRGCYSPGISSGGPGISYQEQALTLLESPLNGFLSEKADKLSGSWIASAQVTGLGALAQDKTKKRGDSTNSSGASSSGSNMRSGGSGTDAIALEILSKEFWRVRLRAKSAYKPDNTSTADPWAYLLGLEYRPPLFRYIDNPKWKERLKNNVSLDASVFTDPARTQVLGQDPILRRLGLNYNYNFWGKWPKKKKASTP